MLIENRSDRPMRQLRALVDFVARRTKYAMMAVLEVRQRTSGPARGYAWKVNKELSEHSLVSPGLVRVELGALDFPYRSQTVRDVPATYPEDWREEFVVVLAHELAHVDQYWANPIKDAHLAEILAERHAIATLAEYRKCSIGNKKLPVGNKAVRRAA